MADDIVTRLRKRHETEGWIDDSNLEVEAADEIERLRSEVARLGSFLHPVGMVIDGQFSSTSQTKWKRDE